MHPILDNGAIPPFILKLWKIVEDSSVDDVICWSPGGDSILIQNRAQFWYELLPMYYRHSNLSSFIRQLNLYGFHKILSVDNGTMDPEKEGMQFYHPSFQRDYPEKLMDIKRKIQSNKIDEIQPNPKHEILSKAVTDITQLRGVQTKVVSQLSAMKQENSVLWKELALLRHKHTKQQQIVNKVIQFLVTLVQPTTSGRMGAGVKRLPLISPENPSKRLKTKHSISCESSDEEPWRIDELEAVEEPLIITPVSSENSSVLTQSLNSLAGAVSSYKPKLVPNDCIDLTETEEEESIHSLRKNLSNLETNGLTNSLNTSNAGQLQNIKSSAETENKRITTIKQAKTNNGKDLVIHLDDTNFNQLKDILEHNTLDANTLLSLFSENEAANQNNSEAQKT